MQLQYVFGNPREKKTKKKIKQGGNAVGKLTGKAKAAFLARMNKGRKKAGLKSIGKSRKGKRKNPARYVFKGEIPVTRKLKGKTPKFYTDDEIRMIEGVNKNYEDALDKDIASFINEEPGRRQGKMMLGMSDIKSLKKDAAKVKSLKATVARLRKQKEAADKQAEKIRKLGGEVEFMKVSDNPKTKRKGKKKYRKAKKAKKSYRKKKGKGKRRKSKNPKGLTKTISFKLPKKRKFRRARVSIKLNPISAGTRAMLFAGAAGIAYPFFNYGISKVISLLDNAFSGKASEQMAKIDAYAPGIVAPTLSLATSLLTVKFGQKALAQIEDLPVVNSVLRKGDLSKMLETLAILSAAGVGMAIGNKVPYMNPASYGLSGVKFFPGAMGGADFGMYPQLGSRADFGGVKFFPQPMGGVEFFQDGARGDEMYTSSERDDLAEAHGLGVIPEGLGVIPEGLGNADFGVIPEGLGGDEGQMG